MIYARKTGGPLCWGKMRFLLGDNLFPRRDIAVTGSMNLGAVGEGTAELLVGFAAEAKLGTNIHEDMV